MDTKPFSFYHMLFHFGCRSGISGIQEILSDQSGNHHEMWGLLLCIIILVSWPLWVKYLLSFVSLAFVLKNLCKLTYSQKNIKGELSDYFTNNNYVGNTKVSVSIKKTYAIKCTLSEIFLTEILKSFSVF